MMNITLSAGQERLMKFLCFSGLLFALLLITLTKGADLLLTDTQLLDYAGHAGFWFGLALTPIILSYLICNDGVFSPILELNMFSLWCVINMLAPAVYGMSGNGLYILTDNINLEGFYKISSLGCLLLYGMIKLDYFDTDTSHCHCERKY